MTLQSSGTMTSDDIRGELGKDTGTLVFPSGDTRFLADKAAGNLVIPTDFYGKQSIRVVDQVGPSALGTSHTFNNVNFGINYDFRVLTTLLFFMEKEDNVTSGWDIQNMSVGNDTQEGSISMNWYQGGTGTNQFVGTSKPNWGSHVTGTSGTISLDTTQQTRVYCVVVSIANPILPNDFTTAIEGLADDLDGETDTIQITSTIPSNNGAVITMCIFQKTNAMIAKQGFEFKDSAVPVSGIRCGWGWQNRLPSEASRTIEWGTTGVVTGAFLPYVIRASSYHQHF